MVSENSSNQDERFSSDLIDLGDLDLTAVRGLRNAVLRAAIERVQAELADGTETVAFFQSSMQSTDRAEVSKGPELANYRRQQR